MSQSLIYQRVRLCANLLGFDLAGITQELKSAISCWCYEQHKHSPNPRHGNVSFWLTAFLIRNVSTPHGLPAAHPVRGSSARALVMLVQGCANPLPRCETW